MSSGSRCLARVLRRGDHREITEFISNFKIERMALCSIEKHGIVKLCKRFPRLSCARKLVEKIEEMKKQEATQELVRNLTDERGFGHREEAIHLCLESPSWKGLGRLELEDILMQHCPESLQYVKDGDLGRDWYENELSNLYEEEVCPERTEDTVEEAVEEIVEDVKPEIKKIWNFSIRALPPPPQWKPETEVLSKEAPDDEEFDPDKYFNGISRSSSDVRMFRSYKMRFAKRWAREAEEAERNRYSGRRAKPMRPS